MSPTILAVESKPRGVAAVIIDGDDEAPCLLPLESVILHRIREGACLGETEWRRVRAEGQLTLATRRGLDLLARRQRTEQELRRAIARSFDEAAVEGAIRRLREIGYLNDSTIASSYVASSRAAGRGRALLRRELRHRGVPDPVAAEALDDHDDLRAARSAASERARSLLRLDADRRRRRLYDFLRRRGFSDGIARRALDEALAGVDEPGDEPTT